MLWLCYIFTWSSCSGPERHRIASSKPHKTDCKNCWCGLGQLVFPVQPICHHASSLSCWRHVLRDPWSSLLQARLSQLQACSQILALMILLQACTAQALSSSQVVLLSRSPWPRHRQKLQQRRSQNRPVMQSNMWQEDEQEKEVDQPGKDTIRDRDDWGDKRLRGFVPAHHLRLQLCFLGGSVRALWYRWPPPFVFIFSTFVPVFRWFLVCIWWFLPTTDSASSRFSPSVVFRLVAILVSCPGWCSQSFLDICLPICSSRLYTCLLAFVGTNRETQVGSWRTHQHQGEHIKVALRSPTANYLGKKVNLLSRIRDMMLAIIQKLSKLNKQNLQVLSWRSSTFFFSSETSSSKFRTPQIQNGSWTLQVATMELLYGLTVSVSKPGTIFGDHLILASVSWLFSTIFQESSISTHARVSTHRDDGRINQECCSTWEIAAELSGDLSLTGLDASIECLLVLSCSLSLLIFATTSRTSNQLASKDQLRRCCESPPLMSSIHPCAPAKCISWQWSKHTNVPQHHRQVANVV